MFEFFYSLFSAYPVRLAIVSLIIIAIFIFAIIKLSTQYKIVSLFLSLSCILFILFLFNAVRPSSSFYGKVIRHGNPKLLSVAITFDDGPHPVYTAEILDVLKKEKVKATFFLLGKNVKKYPNIAKRITKEGHAIGNHTYSHPSLLTARTKKIRREIQLTEEEIKKTCGIKTNLFRPPYGIINPFVSKITKEMGYTVIEWSVSSQDWLKLGKKKGIVRILKKSKPGSIILFHDGGGDRTQTVKALPEIIKDLRKRGYKFVTIPELINND